MDYRTKYRVSFNCDAEYLAKLQEFDLKVGGSRGEIALYEIEENQTIVEVVPPKVIATAGRYGDKQELKGVVLSFERDIEIFYGTNETGEHVAILPIKVTYRRKIS